MLAFWSPFLWLFFSARRKNRREERRAKIARPLNIVKIFRFVKAESAAFLPEPRSQSHRAESGKSALAPVPGGQAHAL
ncbi:hypothetical protein GCWU000341_02092 [Oribacterium sp. oral taxon 078 str. F0262]|nr:hypothetical protein GCWU000341_02092 [Oribacterium sp. oral taxon 078 str. F0262]